MTAPGIVILDLSGSRHGHRGQYADFLARLFPARFAGFGSGGLLARAPVLVPMVEDSFVRYVLTCLLRAMLGRRTVGLLFRPLPALDGTGARHVLKRLALRMLRRLSPVRTITILPFTVDPRFATIADAGIYDLQLWDLHVDTGNVQPKSDGPLATSIRAVAGDRQVCIAVGRQDRSKGFDEFVRAWLASPQLRRKTLFASGGKVRGDLLAEVAAFSQAGGFACDRFISDDELMQLYAVADLVWCVYAPQYDQASGVLGRALQAGLPVVVRSGSLIHRLCELEGAPHIAFDSQGDPQMLANIPPRQPADQAAARARLHAAYSLGVLEDALGVAVQAPHSAPS